MICFESASIVVQLTFCPLNLNISMNHVQHAGSDG